MGKVRGGGARRTTIHDVAAHAGVSSMTVSRVTSGHPNVRKETRAKVLAAMAALNFVPNEAARRLAGTSPIRIGLAYDNPSAAYLSALLVGALEQSSSLGHPLILEHCADTNGAPDWALLGQLLDSVDALIVPPPLCEAPELAAEIASRELPAVALAPGLALDGLSSIRIDNRAAAHAMGRHLVELGHRRFGLIEGNPNQTASALRLQGFRDALAEAGLPEEALVTAPGLFDYRSGLEAAERLLNVRPRVTAIFASNDDMAAAASAVAHRMRLDVPGDVSVAGFDDTLLAGIVWPPLTTVHQPVAAMARAAVDAVVTQVGRLRSGEPPDLSDAVLDFALVKRESTGVAPF